MTLERTFSDNISDPIYYGAVMGDRIVGVNSVHHIDDTVRSRGLWVNPEYRNRGIGQNLLKHAITLAGDSVIWSFPRSEALSVYQKAGFKVCSEELIDTVDNKKNFYVKHATDNS
jgi:GNAT superfamily N-acetyltransferase